MMEKRANMRWTSQTHPPNMGTKKIVKKRRTSQISPATTRNRMIPAPHRYPRTVYPGTSLTAKLKRRTGKWRQDGQLPPLIKNTDRVKTNTGKAQKGRLNRRDAVEYTINFSYLLVFRTH